MIRTLSAVAALAILAGACTATGDERVDQATITTTDTEANESTTTEPFVATSNAQPTIKETEPTTEAETVSQVDTFVINQGLARTLNLGAVFEVAKGETWANDFAPEDLDDIAARGFTAVRVPIRWSDWTGPSPTFSIDPVIYEQIDTVVERALDNDLSVVIDVHHFEELDANPDAPSA